MIVVVVVVVVVTPLKCKYDPEPDWMRLMTF